MIIFGAGVIGEATLHACRAKGIEVEAFADDFVEGAVLGVPVVKPETISDGIFYLTSPNIGDMILRLDGLGLNRWKSCGEVLNGFDITGLSFSNKSYSPEHIKYLIRTALHHHENYLHPEKLTVQSIDIIVTERCSMKCVDCSNLMQYYEHPENADLNGLFATIDRLCNIMDEVYEFRVIGGEPFMHKEVHLVVEKLASKENVRRVSIFTNATIVPKEHQWKSLTHEKVYFFVTDYDELSRNIRPLVDELERRGINYVSEKANGWTDCASLEKHNRTDKENEKIWNQCCAKNLATLADGRLYRCPFTANAMKLGAVPDYKEDYLVVAESSRSDVDSFLRGKRYLDTCDHCNGRSYSDPVITPAVQTKTPLKYRKFQLVQIGS